MQKTAGVFYILHFAFCLLCMAGLGMKLALPIVPGKQLS